LYTSLDLGSQLPRWRLTDCSGLSEVSTGPPRRQQLSDVRKPAAMREHFPPSSGRDRIQGLIDVHFHSAPDVFDRCMDDEGAAWLCKERGMEAIVLKNHVVPTADRAWFVRKHVNGLKVFGGVALNAAVGGINPDAVQWMSRMQGGYGRFVWFPTIDSDHHVRHFDDGPAGIKVLQPSGDVLPEVYEVLKICAKHRLVVNTGHLSPEEALAVIAASRDVGVDRLIVTHAQFEIVHMSLAQMKQATAMGAKLEICAVGPLMGAHSHLEWMRAWRQVSISETVEAVHAIGADHFVLGTDLGQAGNPLHVDGLEMFVNDLIHGGVSSDEIKLMGREVPGALLLG